MNAGTVRAGPRAWPPRALALLLLCALALGCGAPAVARNSVPAPAAATAATAAPHTALVIGASLRAGATAPAGCGQAPPVAPGTSGDITIPANPAISEGHATRNYRVHTPAGYDATRPLPVLLNFHGHGGTAAGEDGPGGFSPLADRDGFLAVYPQGLPDGPGGTPFWASVGPIDYGIDDIAFVGAVLDSLERTFCVDSRRIYVTGFSSGGGMVGFLACRMANRIAAFAPVSGNFYEPPGGCVPARPAPILDFHGSADPLLPYEGIPARENPDWPLPSILGWLSGWAARDGCAAGPRTFLRQPNVTGLRWTGCTPGTAVVHYRVEGGGHAWPPAIQGQSANQVIWRFFQTYALPA